MQNTNRRRRGTLVHTTTSHTNINTHTHTRTQERGYGRIIDWREWKWSCSTENRGPQLFVPCCISLSETPANTHDTHTHTQIQRTSPFPKAVCLHSRHTAQKERKIEILRQCHSLASGLGYDKHVCMVTLSRWGGPEASVSWSSSLQRALAERAFPYILF